METPKFWIVWVPEPHGVMTPNGIFYNRDAAEHFLGMMNARYRSEDYIQELTPPGRKNNAAEFTSDYYWNELLDGIKEGNVGKAANAAGILADRNIKGEQMPGSLRELL